MNPTLRLNFIGNANNLNDNRNPGKDDSWTPDMMPSGTREYRTFSANYSFRPLDESAECRGNVDFYQSIGDMRTNGSITNFLPGGNTFEYKFAALRSNNLRVTTTHHLNTFNLDGKRMRLGLFAKGGYTRNSDRSSSLSASFNVEQDSVTREMLEAIYVSGTPQALKALINRSGTRSNTRATDWNVQLFPLIEWKLSGGRSIINYELGFKYHSRKGDNWNDYDINYGDNAVAATRRRQYVDNAPNNELSSIHNITWSTFIRSVTLSVNYEYRFEDTHRDSYMYALERLGEDMGVYGVVPAGYLEALDPDNSYRTRIMLNRHTLSPKISWSYVAPSKTRLTVYCYPEISIQHRHMDYYRSGRDYPVKRTSVIASLPANRFRAEVGWGYDPTDKRGRVPRNKVAFTSSITTRTPELTHMVDIVSDADPLNISLGNPDLRNSYRFTNALHWQFNHLSRHLINMVTLSNTNVIDDLVRGYTYETATGIRRNRTYNVNGNRDFGIEEYLSYQFGRRDQFDLSYKGAATISRSADMVGENAIEPVRTMADNRFLEQTLRFGYTIGKQHLMFKGSWTGRHTTSDRVNTGTLDADHWSAGVIGQFNLSHGFGLNTDFSVYRRSGYGISEIDKTDPIWNLRLTYAPHGGHWVIMADGFDLLHRLTNVNYLVDATGRVVTYSNALPRYFMLSVQYRFNRQPKGRNKR
ncbi:MAG: outer membrane beta-barrel family protein [Duncaniella sp.]|nr:outer membrane beta-barrel family protein [Duncaniella sp.]